MTLKDRPGRRLLWMTFLAVLFLVLEPNTHFLAAQDGKLTQVNPYFAVGTVTIDGQDVGKVIISGPPEPPAGFLRTTAEAHPRAGITTLSNVPAFTWCFGCAPTSAAMIAGYYDRTDYTNMYTGPTNGGVMPLDNSSWGTWVDSCYAARAQCPLSATRNGLDSRATRGHVDDYWVCYENSGSDPFDGNWTEHTYGDCTADYMKSNQSGYGNTDGSTNFHTYTNGAKYTGTGAGGNDGGYGIQLFYESRGYTVVERYNRILLGYDWDGPGTDYDPATQGATFDDYKAEIDAGRPVMIHLKGHTMVGIGYNDSTNTIYIHDTWDYNTHTMTWGGDYSGMTHFAVTIVRLSAPIVVNFPDPGLKAAIRDAVGKATGDIYDTNLIGLTSLDASDRSIANLEGIQHCVDLTTLDLWYNQVVNISALSGLTSLTYLGLSQNQIVDISALSGLANLTELELDDNEIIDITTLSGLVNLTYLSLTWNQIVDISALSGLTNLTLLWLHDNEIVDISALSGLSNLTWLNLVGNQIVDITTLSGLTNLTTLYLGSNQIVDISALSGLTSLTYLGLSQNQIVDISALSGLTNLTELWLHDNEIVDISALSGLTNLTELSLDGNQIVDISALSGLTNLTWLFLNDNQISSIAPLVGNAGINSGDNVDVRWNQLLLAPGSPDMLDIETLQGRGVVVSYDPQNSPTDTAAVFRVDGEGNVYADGSYYGAAFLTGSADVAEWVLISEPIGPGDVLELDPTNPQHYRRSTEACSALLAGVVSTAPGVALGGSLVASERALLALTGIVPVKVTNEAGSIQPGDLLVTSSTPGHAMRWAAPDPCLCSMVGKALEPMTEEFGVILVLLTAH